MQNFDLKMASFFMYRLVSGNCGPMILNDTSENFREENGVVLSGSLGKHSQSDSHEVYPQRYFFLLKGELCYAAKWLWDAERAMATTFEKRRIYCSPFLKVERQASFVNMTVDLKDLAQLPFLMLNDIDCTTPQFKLSIKATDNESAILWENKIKNQVGTISLPSKILIDTLSDSDFPSNLNKAIWTLILYGNRNLFTFFTSCVTHDTEEEQADCTDEKSCIEMFYYLHKSVRNICLEMKIPTDEIALAYVLHRATRNIFDRVFLLIADIMPSAVTAFIDGKNLKDVLASLALANVSESTSAALSLGNTKNLSPCNMLFDVALSVSADTSDESIGFEKICRDAILIALEHPSLRVEVVDEEITVVPQGGKQQLC